MFPGHRRRGTLPVAFISGPISRKHDNEVDVSIESTRCIGNLFVPIFPNPNPNPVEPLFAILSSAIFFRLRSTDSVVSSPRRMSLEVHLSAAKWISSRWKLSSAQESPVGTRLIGIASILQVISRVDGRPVRLHACRVLERYRSDV